MSRTIIVLGMHRSGTSCLAGCLAHSGVFFGATMPASKHNPKGYYEQMRIARLHNKVLASSGGSWLQPPPPHQVVWKKSQVRERARIINSFKGHPIWGFKDPRTLSVLDSWLDVLPDVKLIGIFRDPRLVWKSIAAHANGILTKSIFEKLYQTYTTRLRSYQQLYRFPVIEFNDDFPKAALSAFQSMGIPNPNVDFYESGLHHS